MAELPDAIYERIKTLCAKGDGHLRGSRLDDAIQTYEEAWNLIPEPQTEWEAATWILAAIGDAHYQSGNFEEGRTALLTAMHCPDAIGNPFLHLRLGQCQFELENMPKAADELTRAYMGGAGALFRDENPRYYEYLKSILDEPPEGWD